MPEASNTYQYNTPRELHPGKLTREKKASLYLVLVGEGKKGRDDVGEGDGGEGDWEGVGSLYLDQ